MLLLLSKLEELKYITLGRGNIISKDEMNVYPGDYPVYSSSAQKNGELGKYGKYMFDDERITWSIDGGGRLFYRNAHKYSVTNVCGWLKVNTNKLLTKYVYYCLIFQWKYLKFDYTYKAQPSVIKKIYKIPMISIKEQLQIIKTIDRINLIIANDEKSIFLLNEFIKSRFIEMFGNPIDNPHNFELNYLSNLGYLSRGKSKHRPRNDPKLLGGTYPLIQTGDVKQADLYISHYESTYSEFGLNQSKLWPKGTLCITIAANIAETAILKFDACFPDSVVGFIANEKVNTIFIRYQIEALKEFLNSKATEVAQKNLNIEKLESVQFMTPEINLQNEFASFVEQVDKLKFVIHSRYFLCEILTLFSSTIAYSRVVSILACPNIFCTCSIGIPLSMAFVANVLLNL